MRARVTFYSTWADAFELAEHYLDRQPSRDLSDRVDRPDDERIMRMARLDCDWYAACAHCFALLRHPKMTFFPAYVVGRKGMLDFVGAANRRSPDESWWLIIMAQHPQSLAGHWSKLGPLLRRLGVHIFYYAFDEASRTMPCFRELAPHLDVLVHDESPLDPAGQAALRPDALTVHRSWVANVVPFTPPFEEDPQAKIVFLGSEMGLTPHRGLQLDFLQRTFKDRFIAMADQTLAVSDRFSLSRYQVSLCPEGRKFITPAMAQTHTDRPFWSGCLGMVPVSEDSKQGGRLEELHQAGLILRYNHGDMNSLKKTCERALACTVEKRRRIYEHFNRRETVATVVSEQIAAYHCIMTTDKVAGGCF